MRSDILEMDDEEWWTWFSSSSFSYGFFVLLTQRAASTQSRDGRHDFGAKQPAVDHHVGHSELRQPNDGKSQFRVALSPFHILPTHVIILS